MSVKGQNLIQNIMFWEEDPSSVQKQGQEAEYHIQGQTLTGKWKVSPGHVTLSLAADH